MSAYYEALGLTREQVCRDPNCVKSAYRKLALQVHPDKQGMGTSEDFQKISRAYQVLSDPQLRAVVEMFPCLPGEPEELLQQAHAMFPGMDTETALGLLKIFLPEPSKLDSMTLGQLSYMLGFVVSFPQSFLQTNGMEAAEFCYRVGLVDEAVSHIKEVSRSLSETELLTGVSIFKKALHSRRTAWRTCAKEYLNVISVGNDRLARLCSYQRDKIEGELLQLIAEGATFARHQKPLQTLPKAQIELLKMHADFNRYLIEIYEHKPSEFRDILPGTIRQASDTYKEASVLAETLELSSTDPVVLGLALNYSVFTFDVLHKPREACQIAKNALDSVMSKLGPLAVSGESTFVVDKRIVTLVQLLRNNLVLWTSQPP